MEVDMQSPPSTFRPMPFPTVKRPRSPGSPTQERQTKRISLAPVGLEGLGPRRASTAPVGVEDGRMVRQDDWVRQARELSIASPLSVTAGFPPVAEVCSGATAAQSRADEHMAVDDEASPPLRAHGHCHPGSSRLWTARSLPLIHITTTPAPAPFSVLTEPPSSSSESASPTSSISVAPTCAGARAAHPGPPDIFLCPATPSDTASQQHPFEYGDGGRQQQQQQVEESNAGPHARMQDRGEGSPRPSRTPDVPASSNRKHRVTMGPRADCVKCRTGVRGHWMHFD